MDEQEKNQKRNSLLQAVSMIRGFLINQIIVLERLIDQYLANYFCKNDEGKATELMELLLSTKHITLENKRVAFIKIVEKNESAFAAAHPKINSELKDFMLMRNNLAHHLLDNSDKGLEAFDNKTIQLIRIASAKGEIPITMKEINEMQIKVRAYCVDVAILIKNQ